MSTAFPSPTSSCCSPSAAAPSVPLPISNPAGLPAIQYRIGTFTSFRRAMLNQIAMPDLMAAGVTSLTADVALTDHNISILDAGGFPPTVPFRIRIGTEYLIVTAIASPTLWTVSRGTPAVGHSADDLVALTPANPFATWHEGIDSDYQTIFVELWAYLADVLTFYQERIANEAFLGTATQRDSLLRLVTLINYRPSPGAAASGLAAFTAGKNQSLVVPAKFRVGSRASAGKPAAVFETSAALTVTGGNSEIPLSMLSPEVPFPPGVVVLKGLNNRLTVNDFIFAVEREDTEYEETHLLQITGLETDKVANTTTVEWQELNGDYQQASKQVNIYSFEVTAAPFGDAAPRHDTLPPALTASTNPNPPFINSWDSALTKASEVNPTFFVPLPGDPPNQLFLDSAYSQLKYSQSNPGWAALITDGGMFQTLHVIDARQVSKTGYSLSAKSTRLTFIEKVFSNTFPLRNTTVLAGNVLQAPQINLPLSGPVEGSRLILTGIRTDLQDGQTVVLRGNLSETSQPSGESAVLKGPPEPDAVNNITVVNLKRPLANQYVRATCSLLANIVEVTQGETVKDEILGSGDGTAFQSYPLKKGPLTYLPSANPEGLTSVDSTLLVTVDGVAWNELPNLVGSASDAHEYMTMLDDSGQTTAIFGDGFRGARPPSGVNNIHARYRKGLGTSGNLPAGAMQQLVDSIPNLQKVTNPVPTSGGADQASPANIRALAPGSLQTFGRAVSAADYAALALSYPGIAKASAAWVQQDSVTLQAVPHPYVQLTAGTVDRVPFQGTVLAGNLRRFLDSRRDPNVPLRVQDFSPVFIAMTAEIAIDPRFPHQATLNRVQAALNAGLNPDGTAGYFAYEALQFGQSIFLSSLYAIIQAIDGVANATITALRRVGPSFGDPPSLPPHDIVIRPTEIVTIDPIANPESTLTITGQGGFSDV